MRHGTWAQETAGKRGSNPLLPVIKCLNVQALPCLADFSGSKAASAEVELSNKTHLVWFLKVFGRLSKL